MFSVYGLVFLGTMLLLAWALAARPSPQSALGTKFVAVAGIGVPTLILVVMLILDIRVHKKISQARPEFSVQVIGHGWWFEVRYPELHLVDANEIHIPAGKMVRLSFLRKA